MNTTHTPQDQTSFEQLGPPGTRGDFVIVAIMRNETRRDEDRLNDRVTRPFKVFARLGKTALVSDGIEGDFGPEDGDSYLYLPQDVLAGRVRFNGGMMEFKKNAKGDYSFVEFECTATKLTDAKNQFLNFALPFLDHQAYIANCPIFIQSIRFDDLNNQVQSIDYVSPYRPVTINQHIIQFSKDLAPVFAMYRKAKNSHSDFYTFLCYHKIMDGLFGKLRTEINQHARRLKVQLKHNRDLVPDDPEIAHAYRMHIGTPIKAFFDSVMTPQFRNAIAHFIARDGSILNLSAPSTITKHAEIMYVSELCVRKLIESHLQLTAQLGQTAST